MTVENLAELRQVERADIYKAGRKAATLTHTSEGVRFEYEANWVDEGGEPIATTLPVTKQPLIRPGGSVPAYFEGLLPEGRRLDVLLKQIKTSADDELSLVLAIGADAVGNVQVLPEGLIPEHVSSRVEVKDFAEIDFVELQHELGTRAERVGLSGVQDKVSANIVSAQISKRSRRYILKLNPPGYPNVVENEELFLRCAQKSGLKTASAKIVFDRNRISGLLVERFDRIMEKGSNYPHALAMEDGCQVQGLPPADKYLVNSDQVFKALADQCQAPLPAARTLLTQLVFAYLSGNGDAHAKNFSILQNRSGEWRVAPAYNLPSTYIYEDHTMAMPVRTRPSGDLGRDDFITLGSDLGLREDAAWKILEVQANRVDLWLPWIDTLPFGQHQLHKLKQVIEYRRNRLIA
jgi:serine/threonine-protein kinase HipA